MKHVLPFYLFFCLSVGAASVVVLAIVLRRSAFRPLRWVIAFILGTDMTILGNLINMYAELAGLEGRYFPTYVVMLLTVPFSCLQYISSPLFFHDFLGIPWKRRGNAAIFACAVAIGGIGLTPFSVRYEGGADRIVFGPLSAVLPAVGFILIAYGFVVAIAFRKAAPDPRSGRLLTRFLVLTALFFPGFAHDIFYFPVNGGMGDFPLILIYYPIWFCAVSSTAVYLGLEWLIKDNLAKTPTCEPNGGSPDFFATYSLSEREARAVGLVLAGLGNKQIAGEMGLSVKTVNNLLYALYRKFGINSRYELIALASGHESPRREAPISEAPEESLGVPEMTPKPRG